MAKLDFPDASYSPWVAPNNVIYTYIGTSPNGYWEANTANAATNLTAVFVERTGSSMTGALKLDNAASVSLPDISFDGDVNTGLYSPGADSLAIATGGTQRVTVDSSGNVGIGTTSPASGLQLSGAATSNSRFTLTQTTAGLSGTVQQGSTGFALAALGSQNMLFETNGVRRMTIESSGRLLVGASSGTTEVAAKFQARAGTAAAQGTIMLSRGAANPTNAQTIGDILFTDSNEGQGAKISAVPEANWATNDYPTRLAFFTTADNASSPTERMRINSSGNVGIGTTGPGAKLEVGGSAAFRTDADVRLTIGSSGSIGSNDSNFIRAATDQVIYNAATSSGRHSWEIAGSEKVRIDSSGKVGIGTSAPTHELEVAGRIALVGLQDAFQNSSIPTFYRSGSTSGSYPFDNFGHLIIQSRADGSPRDIIFATGVSGANKTVIDSSGRLLLGTSSSIDVASTAPAIMQVTQGGSGLSGAFYSTANASGPGGVIALGHGRNSSSGLLSSGDVMGQVRFAGADGTDLETVGAQISAEVDGTPGANDMPGRLVFSTTADGASSPTERLRIDSSGSVGIANTSPSRDPGGTHSLALGNNTRAASLDLYGNTKNYAIYSGNVGQLGFYSLSDSTERMTIDSSGNVGIGTTGANTKLQIENGSISVGSSTNTNSTNTLIAGYGYILSGTKYGNTSIRSTYSNATNSASLEFYTALESTTTAERMRIDSSGNVGIGTTSASGLLHLAGSAASLYFEDTASSNTLSRIYKSGSSLLINSRHTSAGQIVFNSENSSGTVSERMRIDSAGNVLIGTSTLFGSGGITFTTAGAIVSPQVYGQVVSSSPRDVHVDSVGLFGYVSSIRESKANIRAQSNVDWIYQLEPVTFNYKSKDPKSGEYTGVESDVEYGLIAEDVESICPELCFYDDTDNGQKLSGIHYKKLITPMLKALQDANSKIETLEQRLSDAGIAQRYPAPWQRRALKLHHILLTDFVLCKSVVITVPTTIDAETTGVKPFCQTYI